MFSGKMKGLEKIGIVSGLLFGLLASFFIHETILASHTATVSVSPTFVQPSVFQAFVFNVTNQGPGGINEMIIIRPQNFSSLSCGPPPSGWALVASTVVLCKYQATASNSISPGNSKLFNVSATSPGSSGNYTWEVRAIIIGVQDIVSDFVSVIIDIDPPVTTAILNGTQGEMGWFRSPVLVSLVCTDLLSGCSATLFCTDLVNSCIPNITFTMPFNITQEGINFVRFFSIDSISNTETIKFKEVKIDMTSPQSNVLPLPPLSPAQFPVSVNHSDAGSGVKEFALIFKVNSNPGGILIFNATGNVTTVLFNASQDGFYEFFSIAADFAGNIELFQGFDANTTVDSSPLFIKKVIAGDSLTGSSNAVNKIMINFSEDLMDSSLSASDFSVQNNTVVSATEISPGLVQLALSTPLETFSTPVVNLTGDGVKDLAGNVNASASITAIDGLSPSMKSAFTFIQTQINVFFSEGLNPATVATTDFIVANGPFALTVVSAIPDPSIVNKVQLTVSPAFGVDDTPRINLTGNGVEDNLGNVQTSGSIISMDGIQPQPGNVTVQFHTGWNLFSVAKRLQNNSIFAVLNQNGVNYTAIFTVDPVSVNTPTTIDPLFGYLIFVNEPRTITLNYAVPNPPVLPVRPLVGGGYSTIGTTFTGNLSAELSLISIDSCPSNFGQPCYSHILGWNSTQQNISLPGFNINPPCSPGVCTTGFQMFEGRGYWVFMLANAVLASLTV